MLPNPAVILDPIRNVAPRLPNGHIVNPTRTDSPCIGCLGWEGSPQLQRDFKACYRWFTLSTAIVFLRF
jgi:hypothetical protein